MKFEKRLTAPSESNKYYLHTTVGGYNKCISITSKGSCLPNCVGYAWGRYCEEQKITSCKLSRNNAENWFGTIDGYKRGQEPKVGAVICWSKGKVGVGADGAGHVAIVEEVKKDKTIVTSNSAAKGTRFYTKEFKPPYSMAGYKFQGFIYPDTKFEEEQKEEKTSKSYSGSFPTLPSRGYFKKGDKGEQVKKLQKFLNWAMDAKLSVDGSLGDKTLSEVEKFQKATKLTQDGLFGKKSLEAAKKYTK